MGENSNKSLEPPVSQSVSEICTSRDAHLKRLHLKIEIFFLQEVTLPWGVTKKKVLSLIKLSVLESAQVLIVTRAQ